MPPRAAFSQKPVEFLALLWPQCGADFASCARDDLFTLLPHGLHFELGLPDNLPDQFALRRIEM